MNLGYWNWAALTFFVLFILALLNAVPWWVVIVIPGFAALYLDKVQLPFSQRKKPID